MAVTTVTTAYFTPQPITAFFKRGEQSRFFREIQFDFFRQSVLNAALGQLSCAEGP
jgi:hypothetical protein